jgi:hypothetical protein
MRGLCKRTRGDEEVLVDVMVARPSASCRPASSPRERIAEDRHQTAGPPGIDGECAVLVPGDDAEMRQEVADHDDLIATRAVGIRQDQGMIQGPREADRFPGFDVMD